MPESQQIQLLIITPERQVLGQAVEQVTIPAHDGEIGVLPQRAPLMCELGIGQLRYISSGEVHRFFIDGGFAQVLDNRVTVLTTRALPAESITNEVVAAARQVVDQHRGYDAETLQARQRAQRRWRMLRRLQPLR